ncbi:hypothetical protein MRX96_057488 [Rhipicephalus microplus]
MKIWSNGIPNTQYSQPDESGKRTPFSSTSPMRYCIPLNTWKPFTAAVHTVEVRMPVRIADYRAIVMTYAQAQRLIFAYVVASNIHPGNLLARLSAFCARALILPALDHAKDATFTSHAKRQGNLQTQRQEPAAHGVNFPQMSPGPTQPSQQNQAWNQAA